MEGKKAIHNIYSLFKYKICRGKGYYDTFLTRVQQKYGALPPTIALAFKQQVVDHVPTDDHDVVIDTVLYPDD